MTTINKVLENFMELDFNSREILLEILRKRQIEEERDSIATNIRQSQIAFRKGRIKAETAKEIIADLNQLLNDEKV